MVGFEKIDLHKTEKNWQESQKMEKKNGFHQPENPFPLPLISFPLQEYFLKLKTKFGLISTMVFPSRKKALKSFPLAGKRLVFKNCIPPNFHNQKEGYLLKIWFFLISIMVSTSRNKSWKILSCLGEIVFFYSEFSSSGNHYRNVVVNSLKTLCS